MAISGNLNCPPLRLTFWNCRGALAKKPEIEKMTEMSDIIILSETCVAQTHVYNIWEFDSVRLNRNSCGVRGMIAFIRNSISY